jgi:hypothetical protein
VGAVSGAETSRIGARGFERRISLNFTKNGVVAKRDVASTFGRLLRRAMGGGQTWNRRKTTRKQRQLAGCIGLMPIQGEHYKSAAKLIMLSPSKQVYLLFNFTGTACDNTSADNQGDS